MFYPVGVSSEPRFSSSDVGQVLTVTHSSAMKIEEEYIGWHFSINRYRYFVIYQVHFACTIHVIGVAGKRHIRREVNECCR